jgi:CheY-specific phosphatase CheX
MNAVTSDSFAGLIAMALERMAFVSVDRQDITPAEALVGCSAHARVDLTGTENYAVSLSATPGMVREIASGMMGLDSEEIDADEQGFATVSEIANVVAGELIMLLTGGDTPMSLGLPREATDAEIGAMLDDAGRTGFELVFAGDAGRLLVIVRAA